MISAKERERLKIFLRVKRGELQQKEAAALCRLDYRYLRRLYQRYCKQGDRGLLHQSRGRPSNRARSAEFKAAVLARYQERYPDFGRTLAARTVTVESGLSYGQLCPSLDRDGFALHNLASLPHISIAGACATGTHGSGVKNGNLSTAVSAFEIVTAGGDVLSIARVQSPFRSTRARRG